MGSGRAATVSATIALASLGAAIASLALVYKNDQRLDRQEQQQVASKVLLTEAPPYAYQRHPPKGDRVWWVVENTSTEPIDDVWVEGKNGTSVSLWQVQRCSIYALPLDFLPVAVNFRGSHGRWRRQSGAFPIEPVGKVPPTKDTADSAWTMDLQGCG